MKQLVLIVLLAASCQSNADWHEYLTMPNGDVHFYDSKRVERDNSQISVWTRVSYKTSVMAAYSYQSLLRLNCSENSELVLQSTFFTDKDWKTPAMATNTYVKPKKLVKPNSATGKLLKILCKSS